MRERTLQLVVTFHTTAAAMGMEQACLDAGVEGRLFPAPRSLTSDCGMAYRTAPEHRAALERLARERRLETDQFQEMLL